jgi:hypothetical protein
LEGLVLGALFVALEIGALRVRFADLMTYERRRDVESETALRELAALS